MIRIMGNEGDDGSDRVDCDCDDDDHEKNDSDDDYIPHAHSVIFS